jgi:hypothetical protein
METVKKVLMLLVIGQATSLAHADDLNSPNAVQEQQKHLSRLDYLSAGYFARRDKALSFEAPPAQGNSNGIAKAPIKQDQTSGLHWVPNEQHPTFEYRFSNSGAMRMHLSHHGAEVNMGWRF